MRKKAWLSACICVALLLGLGLELPRLTFLIQDGQMAREVVHREDVGISLVMSEPMDIFEAMALFREADTIIQLSEGKKLTKETALQAGQEAIAALSGAGGNPPDTGRPKAIPYLFTLKDDPERGGIFWHYGWVVEWDGVADEPPLAEWMWGNSLWVDDETGKLVGAENLRWRSPVQAEKDLAPGKKFDYAQELVGFVGRFCSEYYGLEGVKSLDMTVSSKTGQFSFLLTKKDGEESYALPVSVWDNKLNFNTKEDWEKSYALPVYK